MLKNPLLRYLTRDSLLPLWQAGFTGLAIALAFIPLCFVANMIDQQYKTGVFVAGGMLFCWPVLLLLPIGLAGIGADVTASFTNKHGPFDLVRLTRLTDKDILHAFVLTVFFRIGLGFILVAIGLVAGLAGSYFNTEFETKLFGTFVYAGFCLLNPMAALVGICIGLRIPHADTSSTIAMTAIFSFIVVSGGVFTLIFFMYPQYPPFAIWQPALIVCIVPAALIGSGAYALALRFIRRPYDG